MPDLTWKRCFDVAVAGAALVATAPLLGVLAVAVRVDSDGPVVFSHTRVGRDRKLIKTHKLRTMVTNAGSAGPQITAARDPRITRVGRWLRRFKLDELPQLWNVVRGDMSIVGPRPEVPQYVAMYRPEWEALLRVRPGLTDLASITFRDEESILALARDQARAYREVIMPMKLALALEGVRHSSPLSDLHVILMTVRAIVLGHAPHEAAYLDEVRRRIEDLNRAA